MFSISAQTKHDYSYASDAFCWLLKRQQGKVRRNSTKLKTSLTASLLALFALSTTSAMPANQDMFSDAWMDARFDWVIKLEPTELKNYLKYPGSQLHPMRNLKVTYRVAPRLLKPQESKTIDYESLWYQGRMPVGLRRSNTLKLGAGWQGIIYIPASNLEESDALANAIARLFLDVNLKGCRVTAVIAQPKLISRICDELGQYNFFRGQEEMSEDSRNWGLQLFVASGPETDRTFLFYGQPRR